MVHVFQDAKRAAVPRLWLQLPAAMQPVHLPRRYLPGLQGARSNPRLRPDVAVTAATAGATAPISSAPISFARAS